MNKFAKTVFLVVITIISFTLVRAANDSKTIPASVNIQKVTVNTKEQPVSSKDSPVGVKIAYLKGDGTPGIIGLTTKYTKAKINNDPVKERNAVIYDEESGVEREPSDAELRNIVEAITQDPPTNFLYYVDGKEASIDSVKKLVPANVKTINFFKNEDAVQNYGEKARHGVIVFTTY